MSNSSIGHVKSSRGYIGAQLCRISGIDTSPAAQRNASIEIGLKSIPQHQVTVRERSETCGALDGKHVACDAHPKSGSAYYNYNRFHFIVLKTLLDADYKFSLADIGNPSASSDARIYNDSELNMAEDGTIGFPASELPNDYKDVP